MSIYAPMEKVNHFEVFSPFTLPSFLEAKILLMNTGMLKGHMAGSHRKHNIVNKIHSHKEGLCNTVRSYLQTTPSRENVGYFSSNDTSLDF